MKNFSKALVVSLLAYTFLAPAVAQTAETYSKSYAAMCVQSVDNKPFGEWDLKGNGKLPAYCECYAAAFTKRAMTAVQRMQANLPPPPLEQSVKEERKMRNTCRTQLGLPQAPSRK